ncbi:MAG TPA: hypothetical protein VFS36_09815 [Chitinophagaceae bacterium]|nr:hypothetical protein [Chitinophagaceae bacterium]
MQKVLSYAIAASLFLFAQQATAQQSDQELNRDSIVGWRYVNNPLNTKAIYKPIKSQYANGASYSVSQQKTSDMLINWIQQSYLPRGLVMRTMVKNDERWFVDGNGPLQSYGVNFLGYETHFVNGKIDLHCCEQGQRLVAGFNDFPGKYIKGFNPGGLYFFAEQAQFTSGDDDNQLSKEGIDKKIQPNLYNYRTYLDHYHDNGQQMFKVGVVIAKNGEWPFKPVLVKEAVALINKQMAEYPSLQPKYDWAKKKFQDAIDRLKPYYNEIVKLRGINTYDDANRHVVLDPEVIINGKPIDKTNHEYFILVSATQQTIDQTKTDNPLWVYFNLTPLSALQENPAKFDKKFGTGESHMVYSMLNNFNYDYVYKWLSQPDAMKNIAYKPAKAPTKSTENNISVPVTLSATATANISDPNTILYEDFSGYATGTFSAKGWHTYGHDGHSNENATLSTGNDRPGKWVSIPDAYTFFPDFPKKLPADFTVNYDVYFGKNITNKRTPMYIRMETGNYVNIQDINRNGFDFSLALSGEAETSIRFMKNNIDEKIQRIRVENLKAGEVVHISISVKGTSVSVSVNNKEISRNDAVLPAGLAYKKIGWYCGATDVYLSNIYIKSGSPVQNNPVQEPQFAGVVKDKTPITPDVPAFETSDYTFTPLVKLDNLPPISYPAGFISSAPSPQQGTNKAIASLPIFEIPERSALLNTLPTAVMNSIAFQKYIDNLKQLVSGKLKAENVNKIDAYLKTKKLTASTAISNEAIKVWLEARPTVALYLFCKALQADYTDINTVNNLASLLNTYGYSEKAIPILQYVNSKLNGLPEVLANMAVAYYNLGDMNSALSFAEKSVAKDSLNVNGNKVAAFVRLNKASQSNNKAEADKAIGCLKQALQSHYDKEASDILSKIESNHNKNEDYINTNFNEFPMLKRLQLPAMPEDLAQAKSFNNMLDKERSSLITTTDNIRTAIKKSPQLSGQQRVNNIKSKTGAIPIVVKALMITSRNTLEYNKLKSDLADIYKLNFKKLTTDHNKKTNAILKKYNDQLSKLEGGEGKADEEHEIEQLKKARCSEFNREQASYLSNVARLTNQFAQQSEYVSRSYWRDYANWEPLAQGDNSMTPFLQAQLGYLQDIKTILSLFPVIEPCVYPAEKTKNDNTPAKPKQWEDEYCSNFKGSIGLVAAKMNFTCNAITISGGEGLIGEMGLNFNEDGTFKEVTIGAGLGAEFTVGNQNITAVSAGASALEYITIGPGPGGSIQVNDWGISAGVSAGGNIGAIGGEINIASANVSVNGGVASGGVLPNALGLK